MGFTETDHYLHVFANYTVREVLRFNGDLVVEGHGAYIVVA